MLHIAAGLVVAYEQLKEGPIMKALAKWKAYYLLATADADFKPVLKSDGELREDWEKTTMIEVSCPVRPNCQVMYRAADQQVFFGGVWICPHHTACMLGSHMDTVG